MKKIKLPDLRGKWAVEGDFQNCAFLWKNPCYVTACDTFLFFPPFSLAAIEQPLSGHFLSNKPATKTQSKIRRSSGKLAIPVTFFPQNPARIKILLALLHRG